MAEDLYVYEFLYRGRAPDSKDAPDYHVILAHDDVDRFSPSGERRTTTSLALTPARAEALGHPLPEVIKSINTALAGENEELRQRVAELESQTSALSLDVERKASGLESLQRENDKLRQRVITLT